MKKSDIAACNVAWIRARRQADGPTSIFARLREDLIPAMANLLASLPADASASELESELTREAVRNPGNFPGWMSQEAASELTPSALLALANGEIDPFPPTRKKISDEQ